MFKVGDIVKFNDSEYSWEDLRKFGIIVESDEDGYLVEWFDINETTRYNEEELCLAFTKKETIHKGDRVILITNRWGDDNNNPVFNGEHGFIVGTVSKLWGRWISVNWDNRYHNSYKTANLAVYVGPYTSKNNTILVDIEHILSDI